MSMRPTIESICERLEQAQKETHVALTLDGRPNIVEMNELRRPESRRDGGRNIDRYMDEGTWQTEGPGFQRLREWVEVHWNPEDEKGPPNGTVAIGQRWGSPDYERLDTESATRKLIAAANLYGPEQVGGHAAEFAAHGMVEIRRVYLLKGPAVEAVKPLDQHCLLLPFQEARRTIAREWDLRDVGIELPEPTAGDVCALEGRYFDRGSYWGGKCEQYASPLLKGGPEQLALLLGLVWGCGFRLFGGWHCTPASVAATLPYRQVIWASSAAGETVTLTFQGNEAPPWMRPLPVEELRDLTANFLDLPEESRRRLKPPLTRLRNSSERIDGEDKTINVGIALASIFMEEDEPEDRIALVPRRAAWCYADTEDEKWQTDDMLYEFYSHFWNVVHGRVSEDPDGGESERYATLLAAAENVTRTCVKTVIIQGRPERWDNAMERSGLRVDSPRVESDIPSVKSDSLSWSVKEQREINCALEAVWRPVIEKALLPPPEASSSMVMTLTPEIVRAYRKRGIPYVVIHPARLYMAHPKWPKTAADPLDERVRYYCERDVERHTRRWREAALGRGLVLFEASTNADIYRPGQRDDWPEPLLSSHENDANSGREGQPESSEGSEPPDDLAKAASTEVGQIFVAEGPPAVPARELPKSVMDGLQVEWSCLWKEFQHDVNVETESMLRILEGIHARHLMERLRLSHVKDASGDTIRTGDDAVRILGNDAPLLFYPKLRGFPVLTGESIFKRTAPDGPLEQTVFIQWIVKIYYLWESHYRTRLKHAIRQLPGANRPRHPVLGDLRRIRNNVVHGGVARSDGAARCKILQWFKKGEPIQFRLRHVLDFLNQMGWLDSGVVIEEQGKASSWYIDRQGEFEESAPALISVRPLVDPEAQDPRYRYGASIVFENGVFGSIFMGPEKEETVAQAKDRTLKWKKMMVNEKGYLDIPGMATVPAGRLYRNCLKGEK